ncbi:DUF305 domain-containing protein [Microbacterium sp. NE2HP2]|uniref:DUF305 domain-containing protein n=1 Tax=Microbacterium thalli TaxID=3027921 RepID=A0ABT5SL35_9MICO|nr:MULTISPECIES: DUF305 domain-containing protein [Microbacterium]MDD7928031.1 DUF305 domain-containing protein [Microbacterium thalli]MDD7945706.1 DUF305 domain-containing protein [Microbacterium plantarum]MDD7963552.1 DUF305 domain-containing protein [Microbacterium thalli]MDN8549576.1 DUF305 domain-containing protein [Microbacterium thalli]
MTANDYHDPEQNDRSAATGEHSQQGHSKPWKMYLRFGAMILTGMVVMYWVMFVGSWEWSHVRFSESRVFMALTMGGAMGLVMLAWMLNMYKSVKANIAAATVSVLLLAGGVALDRSQITVNDTAWMNAMIPHHSLAITRSERAQIQDVRVCELAAEISAAQRNEILEMKWLINDIQRNGVADTPEEALARSAPTFDQSALRDCPTE